ncbi:uncharacterized protein LOC119840290 isoform X2 [Zerene cesonia]|uniref:uncharacterized protein LOC119840290 isoform X2 n=1 Tax=Zerene cesonia TaxID=33412 RepID=UPI0018E54A27|nr:uncharacterized protein LOC119840290 isoform X2 [Zerene cesonia]
MDGGKLEALPPGLVHLDTVRALHQTVVSLRTALELSKSELKELKEKYKEHSRCLEHTDIIEKLTIENHILRRKIIDTDGYESPQHLDLESAHRPCKSFTKESCSEVLIKTATTEYDTEEDQEGDPVAPQGDLITNKLQEIVEEPSVASNHSEDSEVLKEESQLKSEAEFVQHTDNLPNFKTKLELLSKFDVKIKVRTVKEGSVLSSTTSDTDSTVEEKKKTKTSTKEFEETREYFETIKNPAGDSVNIKTASSENIKMAVPSEAENKTDKFDVQVKITSEDSVVVKENIERVRKRDTYNLDVDNLSLRSMSEGDNSVFSECNQMQPSGEADDKQDDNASGNESEEVDDIELIFTTDESKDMSNLQEDLVSIQETDHWTPGSGSTTHSTPVLIKFHTLDPDFQPGQKLIPIKSHENIRHQMNDPSLKVKRVSLPNDKEIKHAGYKGNLDLPGRGILKSFNNKSDNMLYRRSPNASTRRLDSVDSLTGEYNRGMSLDNTKSSSFELGSSMDILHREASVDSFHRSSRFDHRFSVFAETDISKCGISEDDLVANLNARRNTCPNPYQYRPLPPRLGSRSQKPVSGRIRPILRESYGSRREGSAQTDMSALPPRWTSDGYLAYKMSPPPSSAAPTLPLRASAARRLAVPDTPPVQRRSDEARRVLLSDIGFTSMVPELSRSAEPLWTLRRQQSSQDSRCSRGSYRSPSASVDRSSEWTQTGYMQPSRESVWRGSLPDVRRDDTDALLLDSEAFLRRSIDNLRSTSLDLETPLDRTGQPYIPAEARQLRLGHAVKLITPQGRLAVGRVRYVGIAGGTAANSGIVVGAEFSITEYPGLPRNDGTYKGRRYFLTPPQNTAVFVPFSKVVMAWAN